MSEEEKLPASLTETGETVEENAGENPVGAKAETPEKKEEFPSFSGLIDPYSGKEIGGKEDWDSFCRSHAAYCEQMKAKEKVGESARQEAKIGMALSKSHLQSTEMRGMELPEEPNDKTLELYHGLNPDMTEEEIRRSYDRLCRQVFRR